MSTLDELLGIDLTKPEQQHAHLLVTGDQQMIDELVAVRRDRGLTQEDVGRAMGISQSAVARIESGVRDLHLSTLRRYAMAVGAVVAHRVEHFETASTPRSVWVFVGADPCDRHAGRASSVYESAGWAASNGS